ncbi:MAG: flagellar biosynthesis anti-sigma factor FlgM [bacterium]
MKISGYNKIFEVFNKPEIKQTRPSKENKSAINKLRTNDEITLSSKISELYKFDEIAKSLSDMRKEEIENLKIKLESGDYSINGRTVARSIIDLVG